MMRRIVLLLAIVLGVLSDPASAGGVFNADHEALAQHRSLISEATASSGVDTSPHSSSLPPPSILRQYRRLLLQQQQQQLTAEQEQTPGGELATIQKCLWTDEGAGCALNPSFMFGLPDAPDAMERVLLQITAMRYRCLVHGSEDECSKDVRGWCAWDLGTCSLHFDDADFAGLLLWSSVALACDGSGLADVVRCSFEVYRT